MTSRSPAKDESGRDDHNGERWYAASFRPALAEQLDPLKG